jgi:hypothetical protein
VKGASALTDEPGSKPDPLLTDTVRKDQIEYRKWIVSLSTFVLTVSMGLVGILAKSGPLQYKRLFIVGWLLLGISIFLNWLIIKNLVALSIVLAALGEDPSFRPLLPLLRKGNMQVYALVQNIAFLLGVSAVALGSILNL